MPLNRVIGQLFTKCASLLYAFSLTTNQTPARWLVSGLLAVIPLVCASTALAGSFTLIDVIPNFMSGETEQNSEPNIAVNPVNPSQAVISSFALNPTNPYFATGNGGTTWRNFDNIAHGDTTVDYGRDGANAYMARLIDRINIAAFSSTNPPGGVPWSMIPSSSYTGTDLPDQPWLQTGRGVDPVSGTVKDRVYIGFNDLSNSGFGTNGQTATVRISTDGGVTFTNKVLETVTPALRQDGPPVRVAVNGDKVYAVWARWDQSTNVEGGRVFDSTIMIRRDDNGATGATQFGALGIGGNGVAVAITQQVFTACPMSGCVLNTRASLGNERVGSDLSVAVDPKNANHVYVAFAEVPGAANSGQIRVRVMESADGGAHWTQAFTTPANSTFRSALPALAVTTDGQVGLMYTAFNEVTKKLEQHFVQTSNNFRTSNDSLIARSTNGNVPPLFSPHLGDYMDLVAVGNFFYGTFSSSNNLNDAEFPFGLSAFQRNTTGDPGSDTFALLDLFGNTVGFSVDPFFFTASGVLEPVPEPATLLLFGTTMAGLGLAARWRRRKQS